MKCNMDHVHFPLLSNEERAALMSSPTTISVKASQEAEEIIEGRRNFFSEEIV